MHLYDQLRDRFRLLLLGKLSSRALVIEELVRFLANVRLRSHFELGHFGDDENLDAQLNVTIDSFFGEHGTALETSKMDADVAEYDGWLHADETTAIDRETFLRAKHWRTKGTSAADAVLSQYRLLYGRELDPMRNSDVLIAQMTCKNAASGRLGPFENPS